MPRHHISSRILILFLLLCVLLCPSCSSAQPAGDLQISCLDVGQGDSIFIRLPGGETMLIDAGNQENGQEILQYIRAGGTDTLNYVIATHPHADHIGGMAEVIRALEVKNIYMPGVSHTSKTFENLLDTIEVKGLTITTARAGKVLFDDGTLKAEFLAPISGSDTNLNNVSAVLMLTYDEKQFLFMGDAEEKVETAILESGADVSADVLKVGHHGSDTSSAKPFLEAVHPSVAIISVGGGNSYGHPDPATLAALQALQTDIWRTDEKGTIVITSDGKNITVHGADTPVQMDAPPSETSAKEETAQSTQENPPSVTVYITKNGEKYHREGCRFLSKSKIPVLLKELDTKDYAPCSVCNPPVK